MREFGELFQIAYKEGMIFFFFPQNLKTSYYTSVDTCCFSISVSSDPCTSYYALLRDMSSSEDLVLVTCSLLLQDFSLSLFDIFF